MVPRITEEPLCDRAAPRALSAHASGALTPSSSVNPRGASTRATPGGAGRHILSGWLSDTLVNPTPTECSIAI